jgi:hypothetical protein
VRHFSVYIGTGATDALARIPTSGRLLATVVRQFCVSSLESDFVVERGVVHGCGSDR